VLAALDTDHEFLLADDACTSGLLGEYVALKREQRTEVGLRSMPLEFALSYNA
jgi:hypothetical protein